MDDCACIMAEAVHFRRPLPIRGAWIEIISEAMFGAADAGRFPFEERGLKSRACERPPKRPTVAPHPGGVVFPVQTLIACPKENGRR